MVGGSLESRSWRLQYTRIAPVNSHWPGQHSEKKKKDNLISSDKIKTLPKRNIKVSRKESKVIKKKKKKGQR